ncbi:HNH endonuclease [Tianweitania sediminis]|uniref:HNH endonuclease n=1 Tax=Tianweitania sediminis TaxID=1502156 RepID=A0A8J7UJ47_9HYPH|nr:HNH endonuclease [Tianweitania sediminis]
MSQANPIALISRKTGNWWADDRRHWCAYCGDKLEGKAGSTPKATRDHVLPRAHLGRHVTIPACRPCNQAKANTSLPDFLLTPYFASVRARERSTRWPLRDLWLVMALAAVEQARSLSDTWPDSSA